MISLIVVDYRSMEKTCGFLAEAAKHLRPWEMIHCVVVDNDPDWSGEAYLAARYPLRQEQMLPADEAGAGKHRTEIGENAVAGKNGTENDSEEDAGAGKLGTETADEARAGRKGTENGSEEEARKPIPVKIFEAGFGEICLVCAGENLGYARGNNLGTAVADRLYGDEYYLICNNDLRFPDEWDLAEGIRVFTEHPNAAAWGPQITGPKGAEQNPYRRRSPYYWLFVYPWSRFGPIHSKGDYLPMTESGECYRLMGCCLMLRAEAFRACGKFDEHTFLFSEEPILSERMAGKGYVCRYEPRFHVIHEHGQTMKNAAREIDVQRHFFDSLFYYCRAYRGMPGWAMGPAWMNRGLNMGVVALKAAIRRMI